MGLQVRSHAAMARVIAAGAWTLVCMLALAPPVLASRGCHAAAAVCTILFSPVCHQVPERTFEFLGYSLAVCHRCSGIYLGFLLGSLVDLRRIHRTPRVRRNWTAAAILPLVFDALAPYSGFWTNTAFSRFATGLFFGTLISSLLVRGLAELLDEIPRHPFAVGNSHLKGGLS